MEWQRYLCCFNITHAYKKYDLNSKYNTTLLLLSRSIQRKRDWGQRCMESVICLSSCSVVLRYLVSSAGAIHGELPLRQNDARGILCEKVRRKSVVIFLNCPKRLFERLRTQSPVTWGIRGDFGVGERFFAECEEILMGWFSALFFITFAPRTWNKGAAGAVFLDRNALWWTPPFVGFSAKFQNLILWSNTEKRPN